jgi:hypothetical protein
MGERVMRYDFTRHLIDRHGWDLRASEAGQIANTEDWAAGVSMDCDGLFTHTSTMTTMSHLPIFS